MNLLIKIPVMVTWVCIDYCTKLKNTIEKKNYAHVLIIFLRHNMAKFIIWEPLEILNIELVLPVPLH